MKEGHELISGKAKGSQKRPDKNFKRFSPVTEKKTANGVTRRDVIYPNKKVL